MVHPRLHSLMAADTINRWPLIYISRVALSGNFGLSTIRTLVISALLYRFLTSAGTNRDVRKKPLRQRDDTSFERLQHSTALGAGTAGETGNGLVTRQYGDNIGQPCLLQ